MHKVLTPQKHEVIPNRSAFSTPGHTRATCVHCFQLRWGCIGCTKISSFKFQVSGFALTCLTNNLEPETITRAAILSILVFGLFAYPSEILPIKIVAITCLGLLANYFALNTSNPAASYITGSNIHEANIKREAELNVKLPHSGNQTAQRCEASNSTAKPGTWNLKPVISLAILLITIIAYSKISALKSAYATWNDAYQLYNYNLYAECLEEYEKALPVLQHNADFMLNYGKALSIAEKHTKAVAILEQAKTTNATACCTPPWATATKPLNNTKVQKSTIYRPLIWLLLSFTQYTCWLNFTTQAASNKKHLQWPTQFLKKK
jgi:hypothetical protein